VPPGQRAGDGLVCSQRLALTQNDRIGPLVIKKGHYLIDRLGPLSPSCTQAFSLLQGFLMDFDGVLPNGWTLRANDGTSRCRPPVIPESAGDCAWLYGGSPELAGKTSPRAERLGLPGYTALQWSPTIKPRGPGRRAWALPLEASGSQWALGLLPVTANAADWLGWSSTRLRRR
jgi:hypothetical protein